jgi:hypothetical protein
VVELVEENARLKGSSVELQRSVDSSTEAVISLQQKLEAGIEDYELLRDGNNSLLVECNALQDQVIDLESKLAEDKARAAKDIAALEVKVVSAEARAMDEAASGEKHFVDFEKEFTEDFAGLRKAYERNIQSLGGFCSLILNCEPSIGDYVRWLSTEVACLPERCLPMSTRILSQSRSRVLVMAGDSIDLAALQASAADSGADIVPGG